MNKKYNSNKRTNNIKDTQNNKTKDTQSDPEISNHLKSIVDNIPFVKSIFNRTSKKPYNNGFTSKENIRKYKGFLKESWALTWPILLIMLFDFFMSMTDVYIAGRLGKETQAAIGMTNQTYVIFTVVVHAITIGTIAVVSRIFGSPERAEKLASAVNTSVKLAAICAGTIATIAFFVAPIAMGKMDVDPGVKEKMLVFIRLYSIGLFFHLMMIHYNGILRACKMIRYSMVILICASSLNILLTIAFVFYTPLGHKGIPIATATCWFLAFLATTPFVFRLMKGGKRQFSKEIALRIFKISWPSGIISFSWQFSSVALFTIVAKLPENSIEVMAALTAGLRIESMIFMPAFAFNMANAVLVGSLLGEGKKEDAFTMGLVTAITGVSVIILLTFAVISAASPIANVLASKDVAGNVDPQVIKEIIKYLYIVMLSEPFMACNLIISGALSGAGDTRSLMRYSLFSLWILRIPIAYTFALVLGFGATAIWWAMNVTFLSQSFLSGRRYLSKKWLDL